MMVGLAVLAILLAISVPNFQIFLQNSQIRTAADALLNGLNLAKAEAVRRNTNVRFTRDGTAWTIECATAIDDNDGDDVPDCPGSEPDATTPSHIQHRPAAEGAAQAAVDADDDEIVFNGLGRASFSSGGSASAFDITHASGAACAADGGALRCLRVIVTLGGMIRMCDPARAAADPQAC